MSPFAGFLPVSFGTSFGRVFRQQERTNSINTTALCTQSIGGLTPGSESQDAVNGGFTEAIQDAGLGFVSRPTAVRGVDGKWEGVMPNSGATLGGRIGPNVTVGRRPQPPKESGV